MNKQELIEKVKSLESFNSSYAKDFVWGFDECRNGVLSLIQALNEPQNESYLHDIKSQIEYLLDHGPGKNKSLRMLENIVDNMLQGNWVLARVREEKVKVPAFVAAWIKWNKGRGGSVFILFDIDKASEFEEHQSGKGLLDWMINYRNHDLLIRAWLDGYEVEDEPKWIVCYSTMYLKSPLEPGRIETVEITPKKELAHPFKSYKEAKQQTSLIGGAIEKV